MSEYPCCHGTPETGHRPTCPYDKNFWGENGIDWRSKHTTGQGLNAFTPGGSMANRHGPNSAYARALQARAQIQTGGDVTPLQPKGAAGARGES